ncbi:uncharacterized protein K489DRAFT_242674 [Dissoconium aciculare CBS 342.82]|uniref:Uncharacterized protein n=1 Tax=Dissoconium aciculare CBS 342.82 TaxID=1314786 RepID=A0A6J3M4K8_9PEZI|nr:uncharacterized protein K489DRAFT_242674 [Dissoconium aciculare CBS 342.82]KAF1822419.1 hypothetical protein K489DRAFT_242674 [Dissoconium aciculare CBS 342.82]
MLRSSMQPRKSTHVTYDMLPCRSSRLCVASEPQFNTARVRNILLFVWTVVPYCLSLLSAPPRWRHVGVNCRILSLLFFRCSGVWPVDGKR